MRSRIEAEHHARGWAEAWNRGDLDALLAPMADQILFRSPLAAGLSGSAEILGKAALRAYWSMALSTHGTPRFTVERVLWDEADRTMLVLYTHRRDDRMLRACELMRFDAHGRQVCGEAFYGAEERT